MKYRVEVVSNVEELTIEVWYYAHEGDNPWELVATHKYKDGAAQGEGSR
jgi:hypothetical protein